MHKPSKWHVIGAESFCGVMWFWIFYRAYHDYETFLVCLSLLDTLCRKHIWHAVQRPDKCGVALQFGHAAHFEHEAHAQEHGDSHEHGQPATH